VPGPEQGDGQFLAAADAEIVYTALRCSWTVYWLMASQLADDLLG
jgi:hypothetical protein